VLVVDDNEFNVFTMILILSTHGINCDQALNGLEAYRKVKTSFKCCPYKLVFMDINMPVMDGLESTTRIKNYIHRYKEKHTRWEDKVLIVALTADVNKQVVTQCNEVGIENILEKPPEALSLLTILKKSFPELILE
jgi:CheY-like chemotaxis protein